jgi:hypothetical protein
LDDELVNSLGEQKRLEPWSIPMAKAEQATIVPSLNCLKLKTSNKWDTMGRPIGSQNRAKPFRDALRMEICAGNDPRHLRAIARKLIEMAEGSDLQAIKEVGDRLDGKCAQASSAAKSR